MTEVSPSSGRVKWFRRLLKKPSHLLLVGTFALFATGVLIVAVIALALTPTLPAIEGLNGNTLKVPMRVYTQEGTLLGEFGEEKRILVTMEETPPLLVKAILAAEDDSFYFHQGVDFLGIARAALSNLRSGRHGEGGSTITMQVARNYFLSPEKTYTRKLKEILLAFKIERELDKDRILELYINKIFLGNRAYGFGAAAQIYFGKPLAQLSLAETALLAGLPKAPSRDNPLNNPDNAKARRNYVLQRMHKLGAIDTAQLETALQTPVVANAHAIKLNFDAPYIAEMVRQYMFQTYSEKTYGGGFHVYTTIREKDQIAADKALRKALIEYDRRHGYRGPIGHEKLKDARDTAKLDDILKDYEASGDLLPAVVIDVAEKSLQTYTQDGQTVGIDWDGLVWAQRQLDENARGPVPQAAADVARVGDVIYVERTEQGTWLLAQRPAVAGGLVALRPQDGAILALAGGFDFYDSSFNRVTQAERQAGSSIKPFIYSAALDKGFTAASLVSGAPIVIEDMNLEDEWRPEDYSRRFFGETRLRKALTLSLNLVAVRLLRAIGPDYAIEYLTRFGFERRQLPRNLSLALGSASATPMQMATAFAVFANGGFKVTPYFIARIEDADHKPLFTANPARACPECDPAAAAPSDTQLLAPRVISAENRFITTSMMRDVIAAGTAQAARALERKDLAGKTGTTNEHRDAWFCGFNDDVVATAWVGFDQPAPLGQGEVGGRAALPMWMDYMRVALAGVPERPLTPPAGIVTAIINSETGNPTDANDPKGIVEYFAQGSLPQAGQAGPSNPDSQTGTDTPNGTPAPPNRNDSIKEGLF